MDNRTVKRESLAVLVLQEVAELLVCSHCITGSVHASIALPKNTAGYHSEGLTMLECQVDDVFCGLQQPALYDRATIIDRMVRGS